MLYERYGKKFFNYAVRTWHISEDDAWDVIYQTLYKIIENIDRYKFESEKKFTSFTFVLFCNALSNLYKKKKRIKEQLDMVPFNEMLFEESGENPALRTEREVMKQLHRNSFNRYYDEGEKESYMMSMLKEALDEMDDWERILLIQRSHNTPYKKIAEFINKPENQLKVYYQRLRKKLIEIMNQKIQENQSEKCENKMTI